MAVELVTVVSRTDTPLSPEHVCVACKHFVRVEPNSAGKMLCVVCARDLERSQPGTFSDDNLARIPLDEEQELTAYPSSRPT